MDIGSVRSRGILVHQFVPADPETARASIFEYIEVFYNRVRRHSALGSLSPEQYEQRAEISRHSMAVSHNC
ncbi:MAG: IS3 family transposase [Fuerstiella sp.]|nr:IS3 family transposase [Fuerstiella sp.]